MDDRPREVLRAARALIETVRQEQRELLEIAEDAEKREIRELVYDLEQSGSLLDRAIHR